MQTVAALILLITQVALGQDRMAVEGQIYPLDMAPNSVDDKYDGCRKKMSNLVSTEFLEKEISGNSEFAKAWIEGEWNAKSPADNLTQNHSVAIFAYTGKRVYADFNTATRRDKQKYKKRRFAWCSLHFLLTEAIQILRETQEKCKKTYRRNKVEFEGVLNKEVRFGSFTSSTLDRKPKAIFGNVSCFEIETCEGAYVAKYSVHPEEKEVLIPPYEKFIITDIKKGSWCKTVYMLKSSGTASNLNCAVASLAP
ncbi:NAD(P)(+)--arginine ADP-ribosyltransferase 2-like [Xyrauchen texanus]|uniref:NAD(P)(+)--arginine ADP-ribosyltransferase 2-like n=1 Tax=Xyrauchen texanus TaxID=154827 RepID=UPI002242C263|nr:NAD(P)(+)--arginine ADP-ribosyltransferase 2-like [Xyrauchen texanus]